MVQQVPTKGLQGLKLVPATVEHAKAFVASWVPFALMQRLMSPTFTYRLFAWDKYIGNAGLKVFAAVAAGGSLEGLVALATANGKYVVKFLATAPWNYGPNKRHKGVGATLLSSAIEESRTDGYNGELYLSSTPESETFYARINFVRTGNRDQEGLAIFWLPSSRTAHHLKAYPPLPR